MPLITNSNQCPISNPRLCPTSLLQQLPKPQAKTPGSTRLCWRSLTPPPRRLHLTPKTTTPLPNSQSTLTGCYSSPHLLAYTQNPLPNFKPAGLQTYAATEKTTTNTLCVNTHSGRDNSNPTPGETTSPLANSQSTLTAAATPLLNF
ncbi:hypothetical protein LOK49_LG11G00692 [Camellia lanceoleosa]|uniref:Uncharacterized protein n=1 Tax=Camellia lanceoleosa TaxID=1840588 RepID=A0ACC0FX12_9ERIC|nr:hypothetical protein LOK49_LG11G00692 [Camellia lanceoleosa]